MKILKLFQSYFQRQSYKLNSFGDSPNLPHNSFCSEAYGSRHGAKEGYNFAVRS